MYKFMHAWGPSGWLAIRAISPSRDQGDQGWLVGRGVGATGGWPTMGGWLWEYTDH